MSTLPWSVRVWVTRESDKEYPCEFDQLRHAQRSDVGNGFPTSAETRRRQQPNKTVGLGLVYVINSLNQQNLHQSLTIAIVMSKSGATMRLPG
jgi:hypothetical protein